MDLCCIPVLNRAMWLPNRREIGFKSRTVACWAAARRIRRRCSLPKNRLAFRERSSLTSCRVRLGTFNKRHPYFHEGLSLPEAVTPLLEIDLGNAETETRAGLDVQLRYRGEGSGTVTTRRPVLDVSVFGGELFSSEVSFRLEARAKVWRQGELSLAKPHPAPTSMRPPAW